MKSHKNLVSLILAGLTGLTMFACTLGSAIQSPASSAGVTPVTGDATVATPVTTDATAAAPQSPPSLSSDEVYKAVDAAAAKMISAGAHHVSQSSVLKSGATGSTTEADIVPPGTLHMVMSSNGNVVEFYVVDGTLYSHVQGVWTQKPGGGQAYIDIINGAPAAGLPESVRANGKVAGVDVISGQPAIIYSYDSTIKSLNITSAISLWVDQVSGLPVKQEVSDNKGTKMEQVITYDSGITIVLPAEAKSAKVTP
jgi:hypothetical protein